MKIVCLTGGIGSGKTTVAQYLQQKGIPVYNADNRAKELMTENTALRGQIKETFGSDSYLPNGNLNTAYLGTAVFSHPVQLQKINALVHPAVFKDFEEWIHRQTAPFVLKEAAILFESGSHARCHYIVNINADEGLRMQRTQTRSRLSEEEIKKRMQKQHTDAYRQQHAHYTLHNNGNLQHLQTEAEKLYQHLVRTLQLK